MSQKQSVYSAEEYLFTQIDLLQFLASTNFCKWMIAGKKWAWKTALQIKENMIVALDDPFHRN